MENKVLVEIIVPEILQTFDVYLPINKKIGNIIILLNKAINELSNNCYPISQNKVLYNVVTKELYQSNILLFNTNIRNGSKLILINL